MKADKFHQLCAGLYRSPFDWNTYRIAPGLWVRFDHGTARVSEGAGCPILCSFDDDADLYSYLLTWIAP